MGRGLGGGDAAGDTEEGETEEGRNPGQDSGKEAVERAAERRLLVRDSREEAAGVETVGWCVYFTFTQSSTSLKTNDLKRIKLKKGFS